MKKFRKSVKEINDKAHDEVSINFAKLNNYLNGVDPIKLLSQLVLTFLAVPEGQFNSESSEVTQWLRRIEYLAGYLISNDFPLNPKTEIDGSDLKRTESLLEKYFNSITMHLVTSDITQEEISSPEESIDRVLISAKLYSLFVRGESYPNLMRDAALSLYKQHENWFLDHLGFTIEDAVLITESITAEMNTRINSSKKLSLEKAKQTVQDLLRNREIENSKRSEIETRLAIINYFGNADKILSFTVEELAAFSKQPRTKCVRYLARLSQNFGYKNPLYNGTYSDAFTAPWDYNTINERPIIHYKSGYWFPLVGRVNEVLLHTFYYDLIADEGYWAHEGQQKYGRWLEMETASVLSNIFSRDEILLEPKLPNGNELCDVLVLHDRNVFIIQCKTKKMRYESKIGQDLQVLKKDLEKSVRDAFDQAIKARGYLQRNPRVTIYLPDRELVIDTKQISDIFLVCVTLSDYQNLLTRLANISPLGLFSNSQFPWAISLLDLKIVCELINLPSVFIHYIKRRLAVEKTSFDLTGDEVDMLGFYFSQGLYFETDEFKKVNAVGLSGFSDEIDKYFFAKYELKENPTKPNQDYPELFEEFLQNIESMDSAYKTDCAVRLLELGGKSREDFVKAMAQCKESTKLDNGMHSFSVVPKGAKFGLSFISMDANGDHETLFRQVFSFATLKKYAEKCDEWVGFGWNKNSDKLVDLAVFIAFQWEKDAVLEELAQTQLKKGKKVIL